MSSSTPHPRLDIAICDIKSGMGIARSPVGSYPSYSRQPNDLLLHETPEPIPKTGALSFRPMPSMFASAQHRVAEASQA